MTRSPLTKIVQQERTRREILHKSDLIPPLPDVVARVLGQLDDRRTEPQDLEQTLLLDQVLVAKILSMVNSPFYGSSREVGSVKGAIMVLGFKTLRSVVLASSTGKYMTRDYACYGHSDKGLWRHSLAVATLARTLTGLIKGNQEQREEMFIAGLLHDIGKLLVAPYLNERGATVPADVPVDEFERETVGIDHTEAGSLVAAKWNLAPTVQEILRAHHCDEGPEELRQQLAIVRLADANAHELQIGYATGRTPAAAVRQDDLSAIGWTHAEWSSAKGELAEGVDTALASLNNLCA